VKSKQVFLFLALAASLALASDKGFNPPPAAHARTYPAHESHDDEMVSLAVDPYDKPDKAKVFKTKFMGYGFLPIRLIVSNDSDKTLMLQDLQVEFITAGHEKLEPATQEDLYRRMAKPEEAAAPKPRLPLPRRREADIPPPVPKGSLHEIDEAQFRPLPVTAHSAYSGFLFFDVMGISNAEAGAHIYVSGIRAGNKELFYFDIPLEKYLNQSAGQSPAATGEKH